MRNHDTVPILAASIRRVRLSSKEVDVLMHPHLPIVPDPIHRMVTFSEKPIPVPILWSTDAGLMMRFDPAQTPLSVGSTDFRRAYKNLSDQLVKTAIPCLLNAGDVLVVENDVVALFPAPLGSPSGEKGKWLKRALIRTKDGSRRRPGREEKEHGYGHTLVAADEL
ncbi:hypothetical protein ACGFR6_36600 [Streptomyces sp. NPDC048567]|uniref:hypothetical protein n=1 Tax=Streptomyces sp. NPDC048567 TaxID=3365570 RepID=UPI003717924E